MLEPAILWKDEIEKEFQKRLYDDDLFYYQGYCHSHELPEIKPKDNDYKWAIVSKGKLIGYFAYCINPEVDTVDRVGLVSFDKGNPIVGYDVFTKMEELVLNYRRIEFRCIGGNPALRGYRKFVEKMMEKYVLYGAEHMLKSVTKDNNGKYRNEHIFEILRRGE